jgi:lipooligosaccharide transport system permease protein
MSMAPIRLVAAPQIGQLLAARRPHLLLSRYLRVYRHSWTLFVSGVLEPILYLASLGAGLGPLVGQMTAPDGRQVGYTAFVAPALLASAAMNGALTDVTNAFFFKLRFGKFYDALLATPLSPMDVALGEIMWALLRGAIYSAGFVAVMLALGLAHSPWFVLAIPAAALIGWGFAAVGMAATTFMRSWQHLEFVVLATLPMFLLSTTFYPLSVYPRAARDVLTWTPLYQGIELLRDLSLSSSPLPILGHALYFAVMGLLGLLVAGARIGRLLRR